MRPLGVIGILIAILGTLMFFGEGRVASRRDVLRVGNVKLSATESKPFPPWASAIVIAVGVVLVVAGSRRSAAA